MKAALQRPRQTCSNAFFTGSIARSAKRWYLSYSEADFEVFHPTGRHVAPMGVKFGTEEGPLLRANGGGDRLQHET